MSKPIPTPETLCKLLRYEPETGLLFWRKRPVEMFSDSGCGGQAGVAARWNGRFAGKEALTAKHSTGYRYGMIFGHAYFAHRVIWAMETGEWPPDQIDHINGVRNDNRLVNLRAVSRAVNSKNQRRPKSNTSGVIGVCWHRTHGKWVARIKRDGKNIHLGLFTSKSDAIAARAAADIDLGFHPNHGSVLDTAS